jgi:hypothetical protein
MPDEERRTVTMNGHDDYAAQALFIIGNAVPGLDLRSQAVSRPVWTAGKSYYILAARFIGSLTQRDPAGERLVAAFMSRPTDVAVQRKLADWMAAAAATSDTTAVQLKHVHELLQAQARMVFYATSSDNGCFNRKLRVETPALAPARESAVVIPFRSRQRDHRWRNLETCLRSLRRQAAPPGSFRVVVAELDDRPYHEEEISGLGVTYTFVPGSGPFNKAKALNRGAAVAREFSRDALLCFLDADICVRGDFTEANSAYLDSQPGMVAHFPFTDAVFLDQDSSDELAGWLRTDGPPVPSPAVNGYSIRFLTGAALWVKPTVFDEIGGWDERYEGWGGEDSDFYNRLRAAGTVTHLPGAIFHLHHERPEMAGTWEKQMQIAFQGPPR